MTVPPVHQAVAGTENVVRDLFGPEAQGVSPDGKQSQSNAVSAPNPPEDRDDVEPLDQLRGLMAALYGSDFPLINALDRERAANPLWDETGQMPSLEALIPHTQYDEWASWTRGRWQLHGPAVQMHLYLVARNRLFRGGQQWVSSASGAPWRTPPRPAEQARVVHNMIAPALDQRIQVITEQRPGFQVEPTNLSPDAKRKAEGRQQALEFQYDQQAMDRQTEEAAYWAGTDGVAFWHTYWDRDRGPMDERMGNAPGQSKPLGDLKTSTLRCEQWRVSANATATEKPYYGIIREVLSETEAAYLYGVSGVQDRATTGDLAGNGDNDTSGTGADGIMPSWVLTQTVVGEGNRLNNSRTVERYTLYMEKQPAVLPEGLQLVVVGNAVVWGPGELLFGTIPIARFTDGSTDPSYFPRPKMEQWIPPQMRVNAALSLWVNNARVNAGGSFFARPDAISRETFIGAGRSIIEIEGAGPITEQIQPIQGFELGADIKDLIAFDVKAFEDMSGYNDVSRGAVSSETATAVATANEQLQKTFAPPVNAAATCFEDWSKIQLGGMEWGYDIERDVGAVGTDRPDLARALSSADFEGPCTVHVEGEKLLPMPKIYRMQVLDNWFDRGLITAPQYMRNAKFATFKQLDSPDEDQHARAKRVADAIRMQQPLPPAPMMPNPLDPANLQPLAVRWTDDESIFQDVIQREVLLQDDLAPEVIAVGMQRWLAYANQAAMKAGPAPMSPGAGGPEGQPGSPAGPSSPPAGETGSPLSASDQMPGGGPPLVGAQ